MKAGILLIGCCFLVACSTPEPVAGPDKQFVGSMAGAASGAGAGAVTGFQLGSATGPGAAVGAGLGFAIGGIRGYAQDRIEEQMMALSQETEEERRVAIAREILADQYQRRIELHPTREIYPGDLFFINDSIRLRPEGVVITRELAEMNKDRLPWSRLAVVFYVKGIDDQSEFSQNLAKRRAKELVNRLVAAGLEPRRLEARGVVIPVPLLIDPQDDPLRYSQAVELIPLDR